MSDKAKLISWSRVYPTDHVKVYEDDGPDFVGVRAFGEIDGRRFWATIPMPAIALDDPDSVLEPEVRSIVEEHTLDTIGP